MTSFKNIPPFWGNKLLFRNPDIVEGGSRATQGSPDVCGLLPAATAAGQSTSRPVKSDCQQVQELTCRNYCVNAGASLVPTEEAHRRTITDARVLTPNIASVGFAQPFLQTFPGLSEVFLQTLTKIPRCSAESRTMAGLRSPASAAHAKLIPTVCQSV